MIQELIEQLKSKHGLSAEQSSGILGTITNYIKEKFPMVSGAIDNIFPPESIVPTTYAGTATITPTKESTGSPLDKISDFIPGATGQKVEDFAKKELGGLFGGNK